MNRTTDGQQARAAFVRASSIDEEARTLEAVASTGAIDSHGTVLLCTPEAVDLSRFVGPLANPVLLAFHDDKEFPVGQCLNVRVEGGELLFTARFDSITTADRETWEKYKVGSMRGFSVRFVPIEEEIQIINGREVIVYIRWLLMEISCVPLPSNPGALRRSAGQRGYMKRSDLMKGLKAIGEGDASDDEKAAAGALYKSMGGDEGMKAAEDSDREPDDDEKKDAPAEDAPAEDAPAEEEKSARAAGKVRSVANGAADPMLALALKVANLESERAAERAATAVGELVAKSHDRIPASLRDWARSQPLATIRSFLAKAPKLEMKASEEETLTRGAEQGTAGVVPQIPEVELDNIRAVLGIMPVARKGTIPGVFGPYDPLRGAKTLNMMTPAQARELRATGKKVS